MKVKKSEIFIVLILATLTVTLFFLMLFNKNHVNILGGIDDDDYLGDQDIVKPETVFADLISHGFTKEDFDASELFPPNAPLKSVFSDAVIMGDYLFLTVQNRYFLSDGVTLTEVADSLIEPWLDGKITDGKYVFSSSQGQGLKDIFGNIIIDSTYNYVTFKGDTALAETFLSSDKGKNTHIVYKGAKKGETTGDVDICVNSRYISINSSFYDLEKEFFIEKPVILTDIIKGYTGDYVLFSSPQGIFKVLNLKTGLIGYADCNGILLEPQFLRGDVFKDGCAQAVLAGQSKNVFLRHDGAQNKIDIIDLDKKNLSSARIGSFYGGYSVCHDSAKGYFVIDENFEIASCVFADLYDRILGDFVLDLARNQFYSISKQEYCTHQYASVLIYDDYYVCQKADGNHTFLNSDLEVLLDLDLAEGSSQIFYFEKTQKLMLSYAENLYIFARGDV